MTDDLQNAALVWMAAKVIFIAIGAVVGGALGSFLGLLAYRLPRGESIVYPASRCGSCGRTLALWENVPVAAWLAFRGKCRTCGARIGWTTLAAEAIMGIAGGTLVWWTIR